MDFSQKRVDKPLDLRYNTRMESREFYTVELREHYEGILAQTFHMTYAGALGSADAFMTREGGVWEDVLFNKDITVSELMREWDGGYAFIQIRKKQLAD